MPKDTRNGMSFAAWMRKVDACISAKIGMESGDLSDFMSYDCWDSEMTPAEGAYECVANDSTFAAIADELF